MTFISSVPNKITSEDVLLKWIRIWQVQGKKIVFTNGCFDILHRGHIEYLMAASDLGDKLIVGLNSDESVKKLNKGDSRPLQDESSRALTMASLLFVSSVVIFNEETPQRLIEKLGPDILVKGGDYQINEIAGSDFVLKNGGEVKTIPLVKGYSTSNIEEKIKNT